MIRSFNNCRRNHNHLNLVRRFQTEGGGIRATTAAVASMPTSMAMSISKPATIQSSSIQSRGYRNLASTTSMNNNSNLKLSTWLQQQQQQQHLHRQQIRTVFIQTENTPNPESIKFMPTNTVRKKCFGCR